jgi:hypothetical protein
MSDLLLWFSRKSPLFVFATTWVLILAGFVLSSLPLAWPVRLVGSVLGVTIIFGYPFLLIFGFPAPYSTVISRGLSVTALFVLIAASVALVVGSPPTQGEPVSWIATLLGFLFGILIFSPFFVATHVLGEARRALGVYKPLDSIGVLISLFYFSVGGVFFLHRSVASAAESVSNRPRPDKRIKGADAV